MDDLGDDDISDTQFNEICENVLTQRELREFSMEWSETDETENECMQGDIEVDGTGLDIDCSGRINQKGKENQVIVNVQGLIKLG